MRKFLEEQYSILRELLSVDRRGLGAKVAAVFAAGFVLFGILLVVILNYEIDSTLRSQWKRRALDLGRNLGDAASTHLLRSNILELDALITKYSLLEGVAYAVIRDRNGQIIAHSLGNFPLDLRDSLISDHPPRNERTFMFRGREVYDTRIAILDGRLGSVHVGIWMETVRAEIRRVVHSLFSLISIAFAASVGVFALVTVGIIRRIVQLKKLAATVSSGELGTPVRTDSTDEIGDLTDSFERMRSSLNAAMLRLERRKKETTEWSLAG